MGGSSPRVWGTVYWLLGSMQHRRFIPACVGNRQASRPHLYVKSVHPRVCGEQKVSTAGLWGDSGSSPRVWGTVNGITPMVTRDRFIPACVGNRHSCVSTSHRSPVHPRVCGEQQLLGG